MSVSLVVALTSVATVSRKLGRGGRVGLEAGALAGGVVGAHYLGLGNHAMLLLREGIAIYREKKNTHEVLQC